MPHSPLQGFPDITHQGTCRTHCRAHSFAPEPVQTMHPIMLTKHRSSRIILQRPFRNPSYRRSGIDPLGDLFVLFRDENLRRLGSLDLISTGNFVFRFRQPELPRTCIQQSEPPRLFLAVPPTNSTQPSRQFGVGQFHPHGTSWT